MSQLQITSNTQQLHTLSTMQHQLSTAFKHVSRVHLVAYVDIKVALRAFQASGENYSGDSIVTALNSKAALLNLTMQPSMSWAYRIIRARNDKGVMSLCTAQISRNRLGIFM